jgi:hypothetical protein
MRASRLSVPQVRRQASLRMTTVALILRPMPKNRRVAGRDRNRSRGGSDPLGGMPVGRYDPLTPAGEHEQVGKMIDSLSRQRGWRLVAARFAEGLILLVIAGFLVFSAVRFAH